jgi:NAD(P)H-nitrite reductase large subunit
LNVDLLICATGQEANDELARNAGLLTARGVVVDGQLRTLDPDIFALGDCARLLPFNLQFIAPIAASAAALAEGLFGGNTRLHLPALAVSVKTPGFPVIGSAGPREAGMSWTISEDAGGISALSFSADGALCAFALGGSHVAGRGRYLSQLAPLF